MLQGSGQNHVSQPVVQQNMDERSCVKQRNSRKQTSNYKPLERALTFISWKAMPSLAKSSCASAVPARLSGW